MPGDDPAWGILVCGFVKKAAQLSSHTLSLGWLFDGFDPEPSCSGWHLPIDLGPDRIAEQSRPDRREDRDPFLAVVGFVRVHDLVDQLFPGSHVDDSDTRMHGYDIRRYLIGGDDACLFDLFFQCLPLNLVAFADPVIVLEEHSQLASILIGDYQTCLSSHLFILLLNVITPPMGGDRGFELKRDQIGFADERVSTDTCEQACRRNDRWRSKHPHQWLRR